MGFMTFKADYFMVNMINYIQLPDEIDGYKHYLFLDTTDHKSEILFTENRLNVLYGDEYNVPGGRFIIVYCSVLISDIRQFKKLTPKLIKLLDKNDIVNYREVCKTLNLIDVEL